MKTYTLLNETQIPVIGFGTWKLEDGPEAYHAVLEALKAGYKHIDTAQAYGNEESVGRAIRDSGLDREDLFITSKIWNDKLDYASALESIDESLEKLGLDYINLMLIHWPNPLALREQDPKAWIQRNRELWKALEERYQEGKLKAIGISNFAVHHIESLLEVAEVKPMVNQIKLAPGLTQDDIVDFSRQQGMVLEAYSPLGEGGVMDNEELKAIAEAHDKTVAQVALRWSLQHEFLPMPRSKTPAHIQSNLEVFDFELTAEEMERIDSLHDLVPGVNPDDRTF